MACLRILPIPALPHGMHRLMPTMTAHRPDAAIPATSTMNTIIVIKIKCGNYLNVNPAIFTGFTPIAQA
jgi:hypothetical protein